jgi:MFS transporter, ACS family, D-galactonate transporter
VTDSFGKKTNIRWIVAGLMWAAIAINYIDRTVLAGATPQLIKDLNISLDRMGIIMSAFFWTYALLQIPSGWFADKFGQKIGLGISVGWWSIATSATAGSFSAALVFSAALGVLGIVNYAFLLTKVEPIHSVGDEVEGVPEQLVGRRYQR